MKNCLSTLFGFCLIAGITLLTSCGGGGSSSATTTSYTSGAQVGEIVNFQVTTDSSGNPASYSYTITKSAFGCDVSTATCHTGSGTLSLNADGTYSMSQFPSSRLHILSNGLLFGAVQVPIGGVNREIPIVGMEKPATTLSDFADVGGTYYNWVELQCTTPGGVNGSCATKMGSALVSADGTFTACNGFNLADTSGGTNSGTSANCVYGQNGSKGKLSPNGDGTWQIQATIDGGVTYFNVGTFIAFKDPTSGQRVSIFDIKDDTGHWGYGEIVAASQVTLSTTGINGTTWIGNQYRPTDTVKKVITTNNMTADATNPSTTFDVTGTATWANNGSQSFQGIDTINSVNWAGRGAATWNGFVSATTDASEVDMLAGSGFFAGVAGINGYQGKEPMIQTGWKK